MVRCGLADMRTRDHSSFQTSVAVHDCVRNHVPVYELGTFELLLSTFPQHTLKCRLNLELKRLIKIFTYFLFGYCPQIIPKTGCLRSFHPCRIIILKIVFTDMSACRHGDMSACPQTLIHRTIKILILVLP